MRNFFTAVSFAMAVLLGTSACAVSSEQSTVGEYVDDATITTRVKARFAKDETVSAMRINVETMKGVVMLSGFAVSDMEKKKAADVARGVPHVKEVRNSIVIEPAK